MNRENQPWWPVTAATVQWSDSGEPFATDFDDVYFSREDGMAESRHVFLQGNGLPERWHEHSEQAFCIAETGFGTGLNFLLTWQLWRQQPNTRPRLHFVSIEKFPLCRHDLERALDAWPVLRDLADDLLEAWPDLLPGQHRLCFDEGRVVLDLWWADVAEALPDLACHGPAIDAWFLDGFAPARNQSMWQESLYPAIATLSRPGATFSTFTAAGHVKRGLAAVGFAVAKVPGFGRKRESLRGVFEAPSAKEEPSAEREPSAKKEPSAQKEPLTNNESPVEDQTRIKRNSGRKPGHRTPWDLPAKKQAAPNSVLVIGAGLAGCTSAAALASRGIEVTLLDAGPVAGAASGNNQGILYTRLSRQHSPLTDFALQSFQFASNLYRQMFRNGRLKPGLDGALCGSFHQQTDREELAILSERLKPLGQLAKVLLPDETEEVLGTHSSTGGYWFPSSGWLHPPAVCRALCDHPGIDLRLSCGEISLDWEQGQWHGRSEAGILASAPVVIVCTGTSAAEFPPLSWLPLQSIRGQTSHVPAGAFSAKLRSAFCHDGYIAPARDGSHCIGATFNLRDSDQNLRAGDHAYNLEKLAQALPQWRQDLSAMDPDKLSGRVGFRCASPDYLPIAGAVPDRNAFLQTYAGLRKNARQHISSPGTYMPGLYINTAHGSRGLSSTPLVAELLASQIAAEPPPLSRELLRALSPARFLVRDLARNRI